jgi:4-hydroxy-2-oxoheptanedioate aldolase
MSNFVNPLRAAVRDGRVLRGAWCASPSAVIAEAIASVGFDYVCVDLQHGAVDYSDAVHMFAMIAAQGATPIARVASNDPAEIGRVIDAGALGIIVPLVNNAAEAERAVAATRYPPRGNRSFGPIRGSIAVGSREPIDLEQIFVAVMVETMSGLQLVDEIAATPDLDAIYCGPADLALALGLAPAYERTEQLHIDSIEAIRTACDAHGILPGVHCVGGEMAARRIAQGFRMTTIIQDVATVKSAAAAELALSVG